MAPDTGDGLARSLAAAVAAAAASRADRDRRPSARSSAGDLHLARHSPPREARRWARARVRRMVEARRRARPPCATISRSRTRPANASGSIAPVMARTPRPARIAGSCTGSSDDERALRRTAGDLAFHLSCAGPAPARNCSLQAALLGIEALAIVDRNSLAGIVRAHEAAEDDRRPADRRLPPRSRRRHVGAGLSRPTGRLIRGSAGCCRSARSAAARRNASSNGAISSPMAKA